MGAAVDGTLVLAVAATVAVADKTPPGARTAGAATGGGWGTVCACAKVLARKNRVGVASRIGQERGKGIGVFSLNAL